MDSIGKKISTWKEQGIEGRKNCDLLKKYLDRSQQHNVEICCNKDISIHDSMKQSVEVSNYSFVKDYGNEYEQQEVY